MDIYVRNCHSCNKRYPVRYMIAVLGTLYCEPCGAEVTRLARTQSHEPRRQVLKVATPQPEERPKGAVKWWDAKHGEWRWVAKRSKPVLKRVGGGG